MEGMLSHKLFLMSHSVPFRHKSGLASNHKIWADLDKRTRSILLVSDITRYRHTLAPCVLLIHPMLVRRHEVCALCFSDPPGPQAR